MSNSQDVCILLIDSDQGISHALHECSRDRGLHTFCVPTLSEGLKKFRENNCDIVLMRDLLPDGSASNALQNLTLKGHRPVIIIYTAEGDPEQVEFALKNGAWDYVVDPQPEKILPDLLKRAIRYRKSQADVAQDKETVQDDFADHGIVGSSSVMNNYITMAAKISNSDANVLITGESGTGKELFAQAIHNFSKRSGRQLVVVDCAALPSTLVESILFGHSKGSFTGADKSQQGLIKQADGGTLFLDEIGEMPLSIQKKLLRVIQERKYRPVGNNIEVKSDFRLISATNKNIQKMVAKGMFREDLYFRLRTFQMELPPLRNRIVDIAQLAYHFRNIYCERNKLKKKKFSAEYLSMLSQHNWPGNVRELVHAIERSITAAQDSNTLYASHLPTGIRIEVTRKKLEKAKQQRPCADGVQQLTQPSFADANNFPPLKDVRERVINIEEKRYLQNLIAMFGEDVKQCCKISGLSRSRLYDLLKKYQISR